MKQPNIIFYFSDQQRWDTLGCYGQKLPVTPNLDELAREGVKFANTFTCQPVCGPARACLQSGRYATQIGCWRKRGLTPGIPTLAGAFRGAGYETAYVGKWHLARIRSSYEESGGPEDFETCAVPPERREAMSIGWRRMCWNLRPMGMTVMCSMGDGRRRDFVGYRADCSIITPFSFWHNRQRNRPFFLFLSQIELTIKTTITGLKAPTAAAGSLRTMRCPGT